MFGKDKKAASTTAWPDDRREQSLGLTLTGWHYKFVGERAGIYRTIFQWEGVMREPATFKGMVVSGDFENWSEDDLEIDLELDLGIEIDDLDVLGLHTLKIKHGKRGRLTYISGSPGEPSWGVVIFVTKEEERILLDMLSRFTKPHLGYGGIGMTLTVTHPKADETGFWEEAWRESALDIVGIFIIQSHGPER